MTAIDITRRVARTGSPSISHHDITGRALGRSEESIVQRLRADEATLAVIEQNMHPGMVLITTELPAHPYTRTGEDFVLLNTEAS